MLITNRHGEKESVRFDKITDRISSLCYGLNEKYIIPAKITQKVCARLCDGMKTSQPFSFSTRTVAKFVSTKI